MILIITNKEDVHPTPVIERLAERGIPFFRLNTESLLTDYEFSWWNDSLGCDFYIKCILNGMEVRGSEITAIWDRRPERPKELPVKSTTEINKHNLAEALGFLVFLRYYLKDMPSIGSIAGDRPAASKMLQYRIAHQVGFDLPESCYSNSRQAIMHLSEMTFAQNYVEKDFELRVTVVGEKVFACRIDSQTLTDDTGKIDWRQGYEHGMKQSAFDLPEDIADKCREYLLCLGLNFGCFDFIVTPSGKFVFLECNPNGQWLWVEDATGLKISEAIADFLSSYERK